MNKRPLIGLVLILYCFAGQAQENDTVLSPCQDKNPAVDSLITGITCDLVDRDKILLRWTAFYTGDGEYFVVEHSHDGNRFEMVGALRGSGPGSRYTLTDDAPFNGTNFYRVKYSDKTGMFRYSKTVEVAVAANPSFRFYPNPVDKSLIIQIDHLADMEIINSLGAVLLKKQLEPGLQVVNVGMLPKGNYYLRITDKQNNRDMMEHFLKN